MSAVWPYLAAILPTILVAIFFYFIIKSMLEGDRRERIAQKKFEAEQDARLAHGASGRPHGEGGEDGDGAMTSRNGDDTTDSSPESHRN